MVLIILILRFKEFENILNLYFQQEVGIFPN